jgi:hypothetical protein
MFPPIVDSGTKLRCNPRPVTLKKPHIVDGGNVMIGSMQVTQSSAPLATKRLSPKGAC